MTGSRAERKVSAVARLGRYKLWIVVAIVLFVIGVVLPLMFYGSGTGTDFP